MTDIVNHRVHRPTPTAEWTHEWRHRGRTDTYGFRRLEVRAVFSSNEEAADGLPNEIVVDYLRGPNRSCDTIRVSRSAAEQMVQMLNDALQWDGQ